MSVYTCQSEYTGTSSASLDRQETALPRPVPQVGVAEFVTRLGTMASTRDIFDLLCQTVAPLGYGKIALFALTPEAEQAMAAVGGEAAPMVMSNYAEPYASACRRTGFLATDPVLALAADGFAPLIWSDIVDRASLSDAQAALLAERTRAGIHDEVTCPIHGPEGQRLALRFARNEPGQCDRAHLCALQVLAIHVYYAFVNILRIGCRPALDLQPPSPYIVVPDGCTLSQREHEVMLWTARGKSASSIATMLNLAENTVNCYAKNAMAKLGTTRRIVAVVTAIRAGLIQP